jgi:8-amino-7-oxononanoate synthase
VDEAHTTGLYGAKGEGLVCEMGLEDDVFARLHTFGKALGLQGAIIVGPEILREYLINYCPSFIYSTAMAPPLVVSVQTAYHLFPEMAKERTHVFALHQMLKNELKENSRFKFRGSGPVNCLIIPGNENAKEASSFLTAKGCDVKPIVNPTVPKGQERIRICLHAFNTTEEVDTLVAGIKEFEKTITWRASLSQE